MKIPSLLRLAAIGAALAPLCSNAQFYGDPPDQHHPWAVHDMNRPQPPVVVPADKPGAPPSDAIVLFDGSEKSFKENWVHVREQRKADWVVRDGAMESVRRAGYIASKKQFGDCQLHVEWAAPVRVEGSGQGRGNSGVFLMGATEVQVLDNYNNATYPDGMAGSVYGVVPPMANALRPPGEWQSYDIIFRRPVFKDGELVEDGRLTVFLNGVLVQDSTPTEGGTGHKKRYSPKPVPDAGPLQLQDHGNPVRFRNIWYREIRKRPSEGGTDGRLSVEAAMAKRAEIAADILKDAASKQGTERMLRMLESLCYRNSDEVLKEVATMADALVAEVMSKPKELPSRKDELVRVYRAFRFMVEEHKLIPAVTAYGDLDGIMEANKWKRK